MPMVPQCCDRRESSRRWWRRSPAATPRAMYCAAIEREEAVRPALRADMAAKRSRKRARSYGLRAVVTAHPASGYSGQRALAGGEARGGRMGADRRGNGSGPRDRPLQAAHRGVSFELTPVARARPTRPPARRPWRRRRDRPGVRPRHPRPLPPDRHARDVARLRRLRPREQSTVRPHWGACDHPRHQRVDMPGAVRVTIELDREVSYHEERIANPDRVFLDLRATGPRAGARRPRSSRTGLYAKSGRPAPR